MMILPQTAEYAIRAATALALLPKEACVPASLISKNSDVPLPYLSKILRKLVQAKILEAKKGAQGGFKYARPLSKITLLDILEAVDYAFDQEHCVFGWDACNHKVPCPLHSSYSKLKASYIAWAEKTTIASIVKQQA